MGLLLTVATVNGQCLNSCIFISQKQLLEEKKIVIKRERDNKKIQAVGSKVNPYHRDLP